MNMLSTESIKEAFIQHTNLVASGNLNDFLESFILFFQKNKIQTVDSEVEDYDMLLFQYGIYSFTGKEKFHLNFTRQFQIDGEDEFYQLSITLFYPSTNFKTLDSFSLWSNSCKSIEDWENKIKDSDGYKIALLNSFIDKKIELDYT